MRRINNFSGVPAKNAVRKSAILVALVLLTALGAFGQEFLNMPTQKNPLYGASWPDTNRVVLEWVVAYGPNIWVYWELAEGDSGFLVQSGRVGWVTTTMVYHLQYGRTYYWRLKFQMSVHPFFTSPWTGWWKFTVDRPLSVRSETTPGSEVSAYPNPFTASTTVRYFTPGAENVSIEVTNILGQRVMATSTTSSPGLNSFVLHTSLAAGTYFCIVRTETSVKMIQLIHCNALSVVR